MTTPNWLPTARALAAVWDGPPLASVLVLTAPDVLTPVPDLDSLANVGPLLDALPVGWVVGKPASGGHRASDGNQSFNADTAAHALALAVVAVR